VVRFQVAGLNLLPDARIPNFAMLSLGVSSATRQFHPPRTPTLEAGHAIDPGKILDLTGRLSPEGTLQWDPPAGTWTVLRFGYTSTGAKNHPAREGDAGNQCHESPGTGHDGESAAQDRAGTDVVSKRIMPEGRSPPRERHGAGPVMSPDT
jgi:hypothetical protein